MRCPEAREAIDPWIDGELGEAERAALETHLGRCPSCARAGEERRAYSASLRSAFQGAFAAVEAPAPGRLSGLMLEASRRRYVLPARLAAAAAAVLIFGALAAAFGMQRATPEETALAEQLRERESADARVKKLRGDAENDLAFVRGEVERREDPAALAVNVALSSLERRLGPMAPFAPAVPAQRLAVSGMVGGAVVTLVQMSDGRVTLSIPGRKIEAESMGDLLRRHAELCRRYAVEGGEGLMRVGESAASVDLKGRLDLLWRTGRWDEDVQWEAYRAWMQGRSRGAEEIERGVRELQERCRRAAEGAVPPAAKIDLKGLLDNIKGRSRAELDEMRTRIESELRRLEPELRELEELRGRAKRLRTFAEGVK